jgi:hypothetical protein
MEPVMPNLVIRPNLSRPINSLSPSRPVVRPKQTTALDTFTPAAASSLSRPNNAQPISGPIAQQSSAATGIGGFFSNLFEGVKHWLGGLFGQAENVANQAEPGLVHRATSWLSNLIGGFASKALGWLDNLLGGIQNRLDQ